MRKTILAACAAALAACTTTSPDVIQRGEAQRLSAIHQDATVLSVRPVVVEGSQSGVGALTGGAIGGLAGSSRSGGHEAAVLGILGAVAGGVIGYVAERGATRESAVHITLQMRNGDRRSIVQGKGSETFNPGDQVVLVTTGTKVRVIKAPGAASGTPAPVYVPGAAPRS